MGSSSIFFGKQQELARNNITQNRGNRKEGEWHWAELHFNNNGDNNSFRLIIQDRGIITLFRITTLMPQVKQEKVIWGGREGFCTSFYILCILNLSYVLLYVLLCVCLQKVQAEGRQDWLPGRPPPRSPAPLLRRGRRSLTCTEALSGSWHLVLASGIRGNGISSWF